MTWTRSHTLALSMQACSKCWGLGLAPLRGGRETPCQCVLRAIFRACYARFRNICDQGPTFPKSRLDDTRRGSRPMNYGFKREEYCADFLSIARRTLAGDDHLWKVFRWHWLLGADFKLINRKLGRPTNDRLIFHDYYRIEARLGRAFRECEPYALFPLDEYFSVQRTAAPLPASAGEREPVRVSCA